MTSAFLARRTLAAFGLAAVLGLAAAPVRAQTAEEAPDPLTVVAKVGDIEITEEAIQMAYQDFGQQLQNVPEGERRRVVVDALVDMYLLARAGEEAGLGEREDFARRMAFLRARQLRTSYLIENVASAVNEEAVRAAYDEAVSSFTPQPEVRARHILVETREAAEEIIGLLEDGGDFVEIARERSTGPSGPQGGDLGWFGRGRMVEAFEEAAFTLEAGEYTREPVETRFGWHVILVEEKRESAPPPFEQIAPQLEQAMLQRAFSETLTGLREGVEIDYLDPSVAPPEPQTPAEGETPQQQ
ncbi:MAG: peptidylprolyl isomerase [Hyphomicrobiaceae bacterium]|nr:peptidylprolyl isomerase [Hyphomicrobiaceae bacterium]